MIFDSERTQTLLRELKLYREWVQRSEEQADIRTPEIEEGVKTLKAAEAFISKLDAETRERAESLEFLWKIQEKYDGDLS